MNEKERTNPPDTSSEEVAVPVDEKTFWHDGYEPIRKRRDEERTNPRWPVPER